MKDTLVFILEIIGTVAFAWSGALAGIKRNMDIFGVAILGLVTAVGGGVIRDLVLGITPPATFTDPLYAMVAIVTAFVAFVPAVRKLFLRHQTAYDLTVRVMDALGLGIFTVVGIDVAYQEMGEINFFLFVFVGVITGVGGGVLRDILTKHRPYIFVKHFYACSSLIGAIVTVAVLPFHSLAAMLSGAATVILLRLLAAHFRWSLPKAHDVEGENTPQ